MRKIKHHSVSPEYSFLANFLYLNERRKKQRQQGCIILSRLSSNDCTCIWDRAGEVHECVINHHDNVSHNNQATNLSIVFTLVVLSDSLTMLASYLNF